MALSWNVVPPSVGMVADRTLCLDKTATRLVPEGSAEAAFQLVNAGREIPVDEVARLGLIVVDGRVVQASEEKAEEPLAAEEPASEPESGPESHGESAG